MLKKILISLIGVILLLFIFFNVVLEGIVENKLQRLLTETFGNYYELNFENNYTSLSASGFSIGFEKVKVASDTTDQAMMVKFAPIFFTSSALEVRNISITRLLFYSDIDIEEFKLSDPELLFLVSSKEKSPLELNERASNESSLVKTIETATFKLEGGSAAFVSIQNSSDTLYAGNEFNLAFSGLKIAITEQGVRRTSVSVREASLALENVMINPPKSAYIYQMAKMDLNYGKGSLVFDEIDLIPKRTLLSMSDDEKYQKTMFDIRIGSFELAEIHFDSLKNTSSLRASSGTLTNAQFSLLRNANHPLDPNAKVLMNESLVNSSFPIDIDTLFIQNASIDYQLIPKGKTQKGKVSLKEMNGFLSGLYSEDHKKDTLKLFLESKFLANGQFTFAADFPLLGVPGHKYKGHISQLPFTDLNTIVTPMVGVQLNDGMVEDIYFTGTCSNRETSGEMIFDYDNLKLQVNNEKKHKKNWLVSDIANLVVRHKSKKVKDGRSRAVEFYYKRPAYQGHIGFYLNGLLDGMMKNLLPGPAYKAAIKGMTPTID